MTPSRALAHILAANKSLLLESAEELLAKETLSEDELRPFAARLAHFDTPGEPVPAASIGVVTPAA